MKQNARWLALAALVWLGAWGFSKWCSNERPPERPEWQHPVSELNADQRARFETIRVAINMVELKVDAGSWPSSFLPGFVLREQGLYSNYLGEADGLRWLVLFIEPDPRVPQENAALDDEHHRLADGSMIHVTVWTQPSSESAPSNVVAFPAAEGWVERVR